MMPIHSIRWLAMIALMLTSLGVSAESASYTVTIEKDSQRFASVLATLPPGPNGLCIARGAEDSGLTHGWATFVHELDVRSNDGAEIDARYDGDGCWRF